MGFSVSVATVCYNEIDTISRCVESVVGQKNANMLYVFVKRSLFKIHDGFNERYKMSADYDWLIRMLTHKVEAQQVDDYFCHFDYTGISYTQNKQRKREKNRIILFNSSFYELLVYGFSGMAGIIREKLSGR